MWSLLSALLDLHSLHQPCGYDASNYAHSCIVAAAATGEDGGGNRWNLDNHEDVHDHKHDDERDVLQHLDGIREVNEICAIGHEQMAENAHCRCRIYLVEREAQEGFEPSPEEKFQLLNDKKRNEDRAKKSDDRRCDFSVGDDDRNQSRENSQRYLIDEV